MSLSLNGGVGKGDEFYETTLPIDKIVTSSVANAFNPIGQMIFFDESYIGNNSMNEHPIVKSINSNIIDSNSKSQISITDIQDGSGGSYLSNEIFYRIARVRENNNSTVKTGHYHLANPNDELPKSIKDRNPDIENTITPSTYIKFTLSQILNEVQNSIKRCIDAL